MNLAETLYSRLVTPPEAVEEAGGDWISGLPLRGYQKRLARRLVEGFGEKPGYLLAVQMSLGKTVTTATAMRALLDQGKIRKVLIIAPLAVAQDTWPAEFGKWDHLRRSRVVSLVGNRVGASVTAKQREKWLREALDPEVEFVIINRENIRWLYQMLCSKKRRGLRGWPFDALIYDESSRLKEGRHRTTGRVKRRSEFGTLAYVRQAMKYAVLLTGTPTPKGVQGLWGQLYIIDQGERLGTTREMFLTRYFRTGRYPSEVTPRPGATKAILKKVQDVMISLRAKDVGLELPRVVKDYQWVDLSPKEMQDYRRFAKHAVLKEHGVSAVNAGVLAGKLLQFANGSVYRNDEDNPKAPPEIVRIHRRKLDRLAAIVAESEGDNLLVAYQYQFDRDAILKQHPQARLAKEPGAIEAWNRGEVPILVAHSASLGHGVNLQFGGHTIVWFGIPASLELYLQFNARLPRPGQESSTVFIRHILARGTFDERLLGLLDEREETQIGVFNAVRDEAVSLGVEVPEAQGNHNAWEDQGNPPRLAAPPAR